MFDRCRKKRLTVHLAVWLFAIALFYAAVCTPLSRFVLSDVLLSDTLLPFLLDALLLFCNYLFYWIAFAFLLYALFRFDLKDCVPHLAIYAGAVVFRYLANQIADFCVFGFPTINEFFSLYLPYCLLDVFLDLVQMGIAVWIVMTLKNAATFPDKLIVTELPVTKLWDMNKRVLRAAILISAVPAAFRLVSRVIYDVWYGAPQGLADLLWMIAAYLFDLVCVLLGYLVLVLLLNRFFLAEKKALRKDDVQI